MKNMEERIATMEEQLKRLKARHQEAENKRRRTEAEQAKKDDARRRHLVGTIVLEKVERGEIAEAQFQKWLDAALTRPEDRVLFKLER
jgi:uncharacterized small protein (DUF1192 family)